LGLEMSWWQMGGRRAGCVCGARNLLSTSWSGRTGRIGSASHATFGDTNGGGNSEKEGFGAAFC